MRDSSDEKVCVMAVNPNHAASDNKHVQMEAGTTRCCYEDFVYYSGVCSIRSGFLVLCVDEAY